MCNLEKVLFKQQAYWVSELLVDSLVPSVSLELICNPETLEVKCEVMFSSVEDVMCNFHGDGDVGEDGYLCTLLGIIDSTENGKTKYIITTDTTEVAFSTKVDPEIRWVDPNKPYRKGTSKRLDASDPKHT